MARKTVDVADLKEWINTILDPSECPALNADNRETAACILSNVLHDSGNYRGFRFLDTTTTYMAGPGDGSVIEDIRIGDETARHYY